MKTWVALFAITLAAMLQSACTMTPAQSGALGGGAIGAAAGQIIGRDTASTLIGMGAGAVAGAIVNDHIDHSRRSSYYQGYVDGAYYAPPAPPRRYVRPTHARREVIYVRPAPSYVVVTPPPPPPPYRYYYYNVAPY